MAKVEDTEYPSPCAKLYDENSAQKLPDSGPRSQLRNLYDEGNASGDA